MSQPNAQKPMDPLAQRALFARAVDLLGGVRAAGQAIDESELGMAALLSGAEPLQPRVLERASKALIAHADACRAMERRISPAFTANLTDAQIGKG
jgi:hypothetical protein